MGNKNLVAAKRAKNDEFYTQYDDIQAEVEAYLEYDPNVFRGKVVYCNCDDPYESNFFRYFVLNFKHIGLKQLITTSYKPSPIANTQIELFGDHPSLPPSDTRPKITANRFCIINEVGDIDKRKDFDLLEIAKRLRANKHNEWAPLEGDGDFRSDESIALLRQSDIVVTNPPFSLFREYIKQLMDYQKQFLIIGNKNIVTEKDIFPLIKDNRMWSGKTSWSGGLWFETMDGSDVDRVINGVNMKNVPSVWFTNLDHGRRHQPLPLMSMDDNKKFNRKLKKKEAVYKQYDNYLAIEVPLTNGIPNDYDGVMGVPQTFLDKYCPEQFELLGCDYDVKEGRLPDLVNPTWDGKLDRAYIDNKRQFTRIFIRHKN